MVALAAVAKVRQYASLGKAAVRVLTDDGSRNVWALSMVDLDGSGGLRLFGWPLAILGDGLSLLF
jgi:hypothetical protein